MKLLFLLFLTVFISGSDWNQESRSFNAAKDYSCRYGKIEYQNADYSFEVKKEYSKKFKLGKVFKKCICESPPKNFVDSNKSFPKDSLESSIYIAPLYIDINNCNGLYSYRVYSLNKRVRHARYRDGEFHYLFLISNNSYFTFNSGDTLGNRIILEREKGNLTSSFSNEEIEDIIQCGKYGLIRDASIHLPPLLIKDGKRKIFSIEDVD